MRTFLALDIPDEVKRQILQEAALFSGFKSDTVNWVREENLHITVQFMGEVAPQDIPELVIFLREELSRCREILFSNLQLQLIPGKKPAICWISMEADTPEMEKIMKRFRKFLTEKGYKTENRKLLFHITLFRIKKRLPEFITNQILTTELKILNFRVSTATLYQSVLRPQGPDYYEVVKFKLQRS